MSQVKNRTLIYDGQCEFCTRWARRLQAWAGVERLGILPFDAPGAMDLHIDLSYERCLRSVQLVEGGVLTEGAQAAARAIGLKPGFGWVPILQSLPLLRQVSQGI